MKQITNWRKATVADIEADALLDEATKIHVLSYHLFGGNAGSLSGSELERVIKFFNYHLDDKIPVIMHNGISYDIPLVEKLLGLDLSNLMVIDTLSLSWYLNTERNSHGLDSFFEDYGIAKPKIDDWENLTYDEYKHRCEEDVKINVALWEDFKEVRRAFPWVADLNEPRQAVIYDMAFNMGIGGLQSFTTTMPLIREGKYGQARMNIFVS